MSSKSLDSLSYDVIEYLEGISYPEKVCLSKRWGKDIDDETYGLSAKYYTALYEKLDLKF
jgi:hypothetical protein